MKQESISWQPNFYNSTGRCELIQRVSSCIQATRMPQSPLSQVEKIMCDADLYHLGTRISKK